MSKNKSFYITTTLPYVNAEPHIGHAMELIHADIIARYKEMQGFDVFFNTGTDEHGLKIYQVALREGKIPQSYTDELAKKFKNLQSLLGLTENLHFVRTTDEHHKKAAQEFWKVCEKAGDIYKKEYKIRYCVGCELEKTDSELVEGRCPIHPTVRPEIIQEDNYFFRLSKYGPKLLELFDEDPDFVVPDSRLNEMRALIDKGLEDFSISRLKSKMPWGIDVPGDPDHVQYVWFDALVNYISTIGWPDDMKKFNKYWPVVQFAGKDQVRQQAVMWQAMLMSAGLPNSKQIVIHGFLNISGQKMSKSLGNIISPRELIDRFGRESFRSMIAGVNQFEDTDVSMEGFALTYNTNLKDGLGNLVSRVMKLSQDHLDHSPALDDSVPEDFEDNMNKFYVQAALSIIWNRIHILDEKISKDEPYKIVKIDLAKGKEMVSSIVKDLHSIAQMLAPFMPETSEKILESIRANKKPDNLFPPIDA